MRILRRRIRGFFIVQAVLLLAASIRGFGSTTYTVDPFQHYAFCTAYGVCALIFGAAFMTTRKPSPYRNSWAIAASLVSIAAGGYVLWLSRAGDTHPAFGLIAIGVGIGGLYLYSQGGSPKDAGDAATPAPPPVAAAPPKKAVPVAGDRTSPWVNHLVTAISLVAEFGAIYYWAFWARAHGLHRGPLPWFALFTIAVLITTVLHECGHALVGAFFKMKLRSFDAGPLRFRKLEGKWKFKFDPEGIFNLG